MKMAILVLLILLGCCFANPLTSKTDLWQNWVLNVDSCPDQRLKDFSMNTSVPTVLHLDLLKAGKIEDPFFADNHLKMLWVAECNVTYSRNVTFKDKSK